MEEVASPSFFAAVGGTCLGVEPDERRRGRPVRVSEVPPVRGGTSSIARIPSLDGFRALSIALVIGAHALGTKHLFSVSLLNVTGPIGPLGVQVFFVISGFLITSQLLGELDRTGRISLKRFYYRRSLRIFPAFFAFLAVVGLLAWAGILYVPLKSWLTAAFYLKNFYPDGIWWLGHIWSLSVEEQFYVLWPTCLVLSGRAWAPAILAVVLVVSPGLRLLAATSIVHVGTPIVADTLATGCALAFLLPRLNENRSFQRFRRSALLPLLFALIPVFNAVSADHPRAFAFAGVAALNVAIALCLAGYVTEEAAWGFRILNSNPFLFVGKLSYSLYLWQQLFIARSCPGALAFPFNVIAAVATAMLSYYCVERYVLNFRDRNHSFATPAPALAGVSEHEFLGQSPKL